MRAPLRRWWSRDNTAALVIGFSWKRSAAMSVCRKVCGRMMGGGSVTGKNRGDDGGDESRDDETLVAADLGVMLR